MKFSSITLLVLPFLSGVVVADNCRTGIYYCGSTLLGKGNYQAQINDAMTGHGSDSDDSIFFCEGGSNGAIRWVETCSGDCVDGGKDNDHC